MRSWGVGIGLLVAGVLVGSLLQDLIPGMGGPDGLRHVQPTVESRSARTVNSSQDLESRLRSVTKSLRECQREKDSLKQSQCANLSSASDASQLAEDPRLDADPFEVALADFQAARFDETVENDAEWNGSMTQALEGVAKRLADNGGATEVSCYAYRCVTKLSAALSASDRRQFFEQAGELLPEYSSKLNEQGDLVVVFGAAGDDAD